MADTSENTTGSISSFDAWSRWSDLAAPRTVDGTLLDWPRETVTNDLRSVKEENRVDSADLRIDAVGSGTSFRLETEGGGKAVVAEDGKGSQQFGRVKRKKMKKRTSQLEVNELDQHLPSLSIQLGRLKQRLSGLQPLSTPASNLVDRQPDLDAVLHTLRLCERRKDLGGLLERGRRLDERQAEGVFVLGCGRVDGCGRVRGRLGRSLFGIGSGFEGGLLGLLGSLLCLFGRDSVWSQSDRCRLVRTLLPRTIGEELTMRNVLPLDSSPADRPASSGSSASWT